MSVFNLFDIHILMSVMQFVLYLNRKISEFQQNMNSVTACVRIWMRGKARRRRFNDADVSICMPKPASDPNN